MVSGNSVTGLSMHRSSHSETLPMRRVGVEVPANADTRLLISDPHLDALCMQNGNKLSPMHQTWSIVVPLSPSDQCHLTQLLAPASGCSVVTSFAKVKRRTNVSITASTVPCQVYNNSSTRFKPSRAGLQQCQMNHPM